MKKTLFNDIKHYIKWKVLRKVSIYTADVEGSCINIIYLQNLWELKQAEPEKKKTPPTKIKWDLSDKLTSV